MNRKSILALLASSLLLSAAAHFFFLQEWPKGQFMVGPNDGLSQIIPFKKFIYEQYKEGNFFYSWGFGLGGGFYSQLAYYFSTSIVFLLTSLAVFLMESVHIIHPPDLLFWMNAAIVVSVLRLSLLLFVSTLVYRYMNIHTAAAFTGAVVYGLSVMYFRHVIFWEFFADAMLWIPFLVFSTEKMMRERQIGFLIATLSAMLMNNFYFAYVNLIFLFIYILARWFVPITENELPKRQQFNLLLTSGFISFFISAVSFVPAVYGFLNNERPPYQQEIPVFEFTDNILFSSRFMILPAVFLLFLFMFSLYKHRVFTLYACLSLFFVFLHFSPLAASAFNGFSAPQYRWEYMLSFAVGGVTAAGMHLLGKVSFRYAFLSVTGTILLYGLIGYAQEGMPIVGEKMASIFLFIFLMLLTTAFFVLLFIWKKRKWALIALQGWILLSSVLVVNIYQKYVIFDYSVHEVSKSFLNSDAYNSKEQQQLIEQIKKEEGSRLFRVDWMTARRNNTPIVQEFNGTSLYSSIFNEELLSFYWHDLQIDMGRESVSRYATLGNRANLHSLLLADYWIREKNKRKEAPFGFVPFTESDHYIVYKNTLPLPFARTANVVYDEKDLASASILDKEHAMLKGIILNKKSTGQPMKKRNDITNAVIEPAGAFYENHRLTVTGKIGGIDIIPSQPLTDIKDFYVHFSIKNLEGKGFSLRVNDYRTTRKHAASIYKTGINDLVIRVPKKEKISIRVPRGTYELKGLELYKEDYQELRRAAAKTGNHPSVKWTRNKLAIDFNNQTGEKYMVLPVPYEKGWELTINGEKKPIEKANYAWTGFALQKGNNHIRLVYYPPYFRLSLLMTFIGITSAALVVRRNKRAWKE